MITNYIGSASDLKSCNSLILMSLDNNVILDTNNIPKYQIEYIPTITDYYKLITRDTNGRFIWNVTSNKEWHEHPINYLVLYNLVGTPVGLVNLNQSIDLHLYDVESVEVSLNYSIINKQVQLTIDVDYINHIVNTSSHNVHLNLFEDSLGSEKALVKKDIQIEVISKKRGYTRNIIDAIQDNSLVYRYSGNLSKGLGRMYSKSTLILRDDLLNGKYLEIIDCLGEEYLLISKFSELIIYKLKSDSLERYVCKINISDSNHLGSNLLVDSQGMNKFIYSTEEVIYNLINGEKLPRNLMISNVITDDLYPKDQSVKVISTIVKDPFTKELATLNITGYSLVTYCKTLSKVISDIGYNLRGQLMIGNTLPTPIYYSDGLLITSVYDKNGLIKELYLYNYDYPKGVDLNQFIGSNLYIKDVIPITRNLLFLNRSSKPLLDYQSNVTYDPKQVYQEKVNLQSTIPKDVSDPNVYYTDYLQWLMDKGSDKLLLEIGDDISEYYLNGISGLRNYDKIFKNLDSKINKHTLLSLAHNGNLYGYIEHDQGYILNRI